MFIVLITKSYDKSVWCNFSVHCLKNSTDAINNPNVAVEKPRDEVDAPVLYVLI